MTLQYAQSALNEYAQVNLQGGVTDATPHRLIQMLIDGALERIAAARCASEQNRIAERGEQVSSAIVILEGLRTNLNHDAGGQIAINLGELYLYMIRRLVEANMNNDVSLLVEVSSLLGEIKFAWDSLPGILETEPMVQPLVANVR